MEVAEPIPDLFDGRRPEDLLSAAPQAINLGGERFHSPLGLDQRLCERLAASAFADAVAPSERRVSDLAADGLTNRQIAQTLYLSPKTVEMHLSRAYRKLAVSSRNQLGRALATLQSH